MNVLHFVPNKTSKILYNALILPHFNYSLLLWGSSASSYLEQLFMLQKRAIRLISDAAFHDHTKPLFHYHKLLTLKDLYNYQLGVFMYKHFQKSLPIDLSNLFQTNSHFHCYSTRSKDNLFQPFTRTQFAHSHVRSSGVSLWNSLNSKIRNAGTLNTFKKQLKSLLLNNYVHIV